MVIFTATAADLTLLESATCVFLFERTTNGYPPPLLSPKAAFCASSLPLSPRYAHPARDSVNAAAERVSNDLATDLGIPTNVEALK